MTTVTYTGPDNLKVEAIQYVGVRKDWQGPALIRVTEDGCPINPNLEVFGATSVAVQLEGGKYKVLKIGDWVIPGFGGALVIDNEVVQLLKNKEFILTHQGQFAFEVNHG